MVLSEDFAICPWCNREDTEWPKYHNKKVREMRTITCRSCKRPYLIIETVNFIISPVCDHDKKRFGESIHTPINCFETRKITI